MIMVASLYNDLTITEVRFMIREIYSLTSKMYLEADTVIVDKKELKVICNLIDKIHHSKWTTEKF